MKLKVIALLVIGFYILVIEMYALSLGINGTVLTASIGSLTAMFGWLLGKNSETLEK